MSGHSYLDSADCKHYYEPTGNPVTLQFNDTFYDQLSTWKRWTSYNVPATWGSPVELFSYGSPSDAAYYTGSTSQTYILQTACRYIWALGTAVDGDWGPETSGDSTTVLRRIGQSSGTVASSGANWTAFCAAAFRKA